MESLSKQELISTITKQADQNKRYESRLRDVVAAYKGLVKEKEALEISLKALNRTDKPVDGEPSDAADSLATLTLSLSTLTAEKSRMEEAFQADKKVTREKYENIIAGMQEETRTLVQQHLAEVNNLKAKIAYEIQEREKERADHAAMMKELHIKLNSERKTKEKLEDTVTHSNEAQASQAELEKRVRDLSSSLEASQRRLARAEARTVETPALLVRLQQKLALLEQSHSVAIREEQIKAKRAEEGARKAGARAEERVAALEAALADLSHTLGTYEARRRTDQLLIQQLRDQLNANIIDNMAVLDDYDDTQKKSETDNEKIADSEYLQTLIDKIHILKKEIIAENDKLGTPIDITAIFKFEGFENVHAKCHEELENIKMEFEQYKAQNVKANTGIDDRSEVEDLKKQIENLNDKIDTYRIMLEEEKQDKQETLKLYEEKQKRTAEYHKEAVSELKTRVVSLEKQVCTQRDRYAALLDETDSLLRARAARVSAPHPAHLAGPAHPAHPDHPAHISHDADHHHALAEASAAPHVLHYAHELARKDLDITQLRRDKHSLEGLYRDCQRDSTIEKERFKEVIRTLKEEIDRLRRIQSREGANLEYLKNVVISYLTSADAAGRRHMLNAIAAVLHFTPAERRALRDVL